MRRILDIADLAHNETAYEFEGHHYSDIGVSFILVDVPQESHEEACATLAAALEDVKDGV